MLATQNNNLYTVIDRNLGIIAHKVSRDQAFEAIYAAIEDEPPALEIAEVLDTQPDAGAWRTEWAAATAVELRQLDVRLDNTPTIQELHRLRNELDSLTARQREIIKQAEIEAKRQDMKILGDQLKAEHTRLIQVLADDADADFNDTYESFSGTVWKHLRSTQLYRDYMVLVKEVA